MVALALGAGVRHHHHGVALVGVAVAAAGRLAELRRHMYTRLTTSKLVHSIYKHVKQSLVGTQQLAEVLHLIFQWSSVLRCLLLRAACDG